MVSAIVAAAVLVVVGFLLFRAIARLRTSEKRLEKHTRELVAFYNKEPFPSAENEARERENAGAINERFDELMGLAREGQIRLEKRPSPSTFMGLLGNRKSQFLAYAERHGVGLPTDFNFGFDSYFDEGGSLPSPDHVPRLMQQLIIIQNLCQVMCQAGISDVGRLQRDEFEGSVSSHGRQGAATAARAQNAGIIGEDDLFAKFHFILEFRAREQALINVLNRLAAHKLFIVVTNVNIQKAGPDVKEPAVAVKDDDEEGSADADAEEIPPVLQRTVSGLPLETPMRVTLELDVYRFLEKEDDS